MSNKETGSSFTFIHSFRAKRQQPNIASGSADFRHAERLTY